MRQNTTHFPRQQSGAILVVALIMLLAISLLTVASMQSSKIGMRMSQNEESRIVAEQSTQALADFIVANPGTTPVVGGAGFTVCTANEANCDSNNLPVVNATLAASIAANNMSARVQRMAPAFRPPPRIVGSSIDKFTSASFRVTTTYDRSDELLGRQQIVEGVMVLVPQF